MATAYSPAGGRSTPVCPAQQRVGNLDQDAGAVADQRIGPDRAAVIEIDQDLQAGGHDLMRFAAFDIGHKPHPARVMFIARVVKTLPFRSSHPLTLAISHRRAGPRLCSRVPARSRAFTRQDQPLSTA
jgi:hypothetical protein